MAGAKTDTRALKDHVKTQEPARLGGRLKRKAREQDSGDTALARTPRSGVVHARCSVVLRQNQTSC